MRAIIPSKAVEGRWDVVYDDGEVHDIFFGGPKKAERYARYHNATIPDILTWKMRRTRLLCPDCKNRLYNCRKDNPVRQQFYCWQCRNVF